MEEQRQAKVDSIKARQEQREKNSAQDKAAKLKALAEKTKLLRQKMKKRVDANKEKPVAAA